ncbi:hypothetical protein EB796_019849 [Bugula neritina]|uniref:Aldose 1-epimerase n=1 Tax=Bugula neritina TaxID=10212 RepID=A0A7J7J740_BUGNE|nr:hypothetical protein EB796_019849 [Bugula neritina]
MKNILIYIFDYLSYIHSGSCLQGNNIQEVVKHSMSEAVKIVKKWDDGTTEFKLSGGGIEVTVYSLGGIIQSIKVPNKDGELADVVLGYDTPQEYGAQYIGGIIGRYSNRVANGKFTLDGKQHQLNINHGPNYVHGGLVGFDQKPWEYEVSGSKLILTYTSVDGEENFPGTLKAKVTYEVTDDAMIIVDYSAVTDKPTIVSLSNHAFFNLQGHNKGDISNHVVKLNSSEYTPLDGTKIPYGHVESVEGKDADMRQGKLLTQELLNSDDYDTLDGFDRNYIIEGRQGCKNYVGRVSADGRILDMYTTHPSLHFYTGYALSVPKGQGWCYLRQPQFPQAVLRPGEVYSDTTWFQFLME